jgi:ribosomal protein S18 acetylase RimI-like enzyme
MTLYRSAEADDAPALRGLLQALADHDGSGAVGSVDSLRTHGFGNRPLFHAILAERDGHALGMVLFYPDFSTHRGQPGTYVQDIYVIPSARGLGLGKGLLARAQAQARQAWGAAYMTLGVDPGNARAQAVYARLGFRPRGYEFLILDGAALAALEQP